MSLAKVRIINCRRASIRKHPWIPLKEKDIVDTVDGSDAINDTVKKGSYITIDLDNICYDWKNRKFYKVQNPEGWIYEGCVQLGGEEGG